MANDSIKIINGETGEEIEREMTNEEQAARNLEIETHLLEKAEKAAIEAQNEANKLSAATKLETLGLTADDLKALGL
jgi:hypothetical protein